MIIILMKNTIVTSVIITVDADIVIILSSALQMGTVYTHFSNEQTEPYRA